MGQRSKVRGLLVGLLAYPLISVADTYQVSGLTSTCGGTSQIFDTEPRRYPPTNSATVEQGFTITASCPGGVSVTPASVTVAGVAEHGRSGTQVTTTGVASGYVSAVNRTRIKLEPLSGSGTNGVTFSVTSVYSMVGQTQGGGTVKAEVFMSIPEFRLNKSAPPLTSNGQVMDELLDSGEMSFLRCPCVFTLVLMAASTASSQVTGVSYAAAEDPFRLNLPSGWTYTFVDDDDTATTTGLRFVPLPPCRVMETRSLYNFEGRTGAFGPPTLNAAEARTLNLPVSNVCSIPSTAKAYVVNTTVIPSGALNFVTVFPAGESRPNVWTIRSPDGQAVANSAIVKAGASGGISVYASDKTDMLIDISGYYTDDTTVSGLAYYPLTPCRVIDTRSAYRSPAGPFGPPSMTARQIRKFVFPSTPYCTVPAAAAYSVTITAIPPGPLPYLTAWPDGNAQPNVSSINSFAGRVLANSVIVPAASDGSIDVFAYDATDFLVDINGYYAPDNGQGLFYYPVTQCRASDSTTSGGAYPDDTTRTINIPAATGCTGIPATAKGYALNVTALPNGNPVPFLTAWPTGAARPNASILNAFQGQIVTNSAIVPAGTNGAIDVYAFRRSDVVVEVSGYFGR